MNLSDSNIYKITGFDYHTTPSGSHMLSDAIFYKYQIPSGFLGRSSFLCGTKNFRFHAKVMYHTTPSGSHNSSFMISINIKFLWD